MRHLARRVLLVIALFATGCGLLFPEFWGGPGDGAALDDGGTDADGGGVLGVHGQLCGLSDVRALTSCATGVGAGFRVTVEETRDQTTCDASGHFAITLSSPVERATVAAIDPSGHFLPTVTVVQPSTADFALPLAPAAALRGAVAAAGYNLDPQAAAVLAWTIDPHGAPVARATFTAGAATLTDGDAPGVLLPADATGARGLVALIAPLPPSVAIGVRPPAPLEADTFTLPVRAGAVTMSTLVLLPAQ
jgi:hypothetical protein